MRFDILRFWVARFFETIGKIWLFPMCSSCFSSLTHPVAHFPSTTKGETILLLPHVHMHFYRTLPWVAPPEHRHRGDDPPWGWDSVSLYCMFGKIAFYHRRAQRCSLHDAPCIWQAGRGLEPHVHVIMPSVVLMYSRFPHATPSSTTMLVPQCSCIW